MRSRGWFTFTEAKANGVSDVFEDNVDRFLVVRGVGRHVGVLSPLVERGSRLGYTDRRVRAVFLPVARLVHQYLHRYARFVRTARVTKGRLCSNAHLSPQSGQPGTKRVYVIVTKIIVEG